ncbi:hypothetical protein CFP56_002922 [Quercus suber]|uniref:Uncharacterized protein n=1 Tax=Quercus suber TaxID=58331 RepID=A0AAW0IJX0_QUESU
MEHSELGDRTQQEPSKNAVRFSPKTQSDPVPEPSPIQSKNPVRSTPATLREPRTQSDPLNAVPPPRRF